MGVPNDYLDGLFHGKSEINWKIMGYPHDLGNLHVAWSKKKTTIHQIS